MLGPQDGMSWGTGSGFGPESTGGGNPLSSFRLALGSPALASSVPASAGSLKDDREMRGVAAAGLKGLLHPLNGHSNQGSISTLPTLISGNHISPVPNRKTLTS